MIGPRAAADLLRPARGQLILYGLAALGRSLFSVLSIFLVRDFLAVVLSDGGAVPWLDFAGPTGATYAVAGVLLISQLAAAGCGYIGLVAEQHVVRRVELQVMRSLVTHMLQLSPGFFDRNKRGDLVQSVRRDVARVRMMAVAMIGIGLEAVQTGGLLIAAFMLSPLTLGVFAIFLAAGLPVYLIARRTLKESGRLRSTSADLYETILQLFRGIRLVRVFRGASNETQRAMAQARKHFDQQIEMTRLRASAQAVLDSFAGLALVVVVVIGGGQVASNQLGWPAFVAFIAAVGALQKPLGNLGTKLVALQQHQASYHRVRQLLQEPSDVADPATPVAMPPLPAPISVVAASFAYDDVEVLQDVSLTFEAGETVAIVGRSGAGKTTLLGLIARFQDPTAGSVCWGGIDIRELSLDALQANLAIVTQEPLLFSTTLADNIRCGRPDASDAEVRAAAASVGMHAEIGALPDGYDTLVGIGQRRMSSGQEQRICIARALLRRASLLILDEATSDLDHESESLVCAAIRERPPGTTVVLVTHRPALLAIADRVVTLQDGRLIADAATAEE